MNINKESIEERKSMPEVEGSQLKKCYICAKSFNFRKKHICRYCNNAVCKDHCQKARSSNFYEEAQPICDLCNQEQIKTDLQAEILSEISSLEVELQQAISTNERLDRDHFEKTAAINKLENELSDHYSSHSENIKFLNSQLAGEELEYKQMKENYEKTLENSKQIKIEKETASDNLAKAQEELNNLIRQSEILKETKDSLNEQLDKINSKLKGSLSIEKVSKIVCPTCQVKLQDSAKSRIDAPSILEDATVSIHSHNERGSVMDSVREFNDILSHQTSHPTEISKCVII